MLLFNKANTSRKNNYRKKCTCTYVSSKDSLISESFSHWLQSPKKVLNTKAELLQLKPHPFICMRNFINKRVGNQKN